MKISLIISSLLIAIVSFFSFSIFSPKEVFACDLFNVPDPIINGSSLNIEVTGAKKNVPYILNIRQGFKESIQLATDTTTNNILRFSVDSINLPVGSSYNFAAIAQDSNNNTIDSCLSTQTTIQNPAPTPTTTPTPLPQPGGNITIFAANSVQLGEPESIAILNIPLKAEKVAYTLTVLPTTGSIKGTPIAFLNLTTESTYAGIICKFPVPSGPWINPVCQNDGSAFRFSAQLDTSKFGIDPDSTIDMPYDITVTSSLGSSLGIANSTFVVKAKNTQTEFQIDSFDSDSEKNISSAKPGQTIIINLSRLKLSGNYKYGVQNRTVFQANCPTPNCSLSLSLPTDIKTTPIFIEVTDPDGNKVNKQLNISNITDGIINQIILSLSPDLRARCNTSVDVENLSQCKYKELYKAISCGNNDKSFVCADPRYVLCMNGSSSPTNVTCGVPEPIAQPCKEDNIVNGECTAVTTALGDISTDPTGFVKKIFGIILSVSGGVAVLLIIISGYSFIASQGNPEKIQAARERLTSAIVGLLFIIFSMVILEVIGVDILKIPGLTR